MTWIYFREVTATNIAKLANLDGIDFNATEDDTEDIEDNEDDDDGEFQSFPHSSTTENDRPSTITEVSLFNINTLFVRGMTNCYSKCI